MSPISYEVTLLDVTSNGDVVFDFRGTRQSLTAAQGSIGRIPSVPAFAIDWQRQLGRVGYLRFSLHPTQQAPALFSFEPYQDQSLRRVYTLDDMLDTPTSHSNTPLVVGWRSFQQPEGFLASSIFGRGA